MYDTLVQRRQQKIEDEAHRTNAIVSNLFPEEVHERLFGNDESNKTQPRRGRRSFLGTTAKLNLKSLMPDTSGTASETDCEEAEHQQEQTKSKPIADLFPETTVMFCDISGFTAWSSVREPPQVFVLLETVYEAFDDIAKRRKVFKVEVRPLCVLPKHTCECPDNLTNCAIPC